MYIFYGLTQITSKHLFTIKIVFQVHLECMFYPYALPKYNRYFLIYLLQFYVKHDCFQIIFHLYSTYGGYTKVLTLLNLK